MRILHHECDALEGFVVFLGGPYHFTVFRACRKSCFQPLPTKLPSTNQIPPQFGESKRVIIDVTIKSNKKW